MRQIEFIDLTEADLFSNSLCKGGTSNNLASEPISKIFPVGNQSGIRFKGTIERLSLVVLYSTFNDLDWPDSLDGEILTYYGDNKSPGKELHDTQGNKVFRALFNLLHLDKRDHIPPIFLFGKGTHGFDRIFKGLVVPGHNKFSESEDLIAQWRSKAGSRFQNYKGIFTLLNIEFISRKWIGHISSGNKYSEECPSKWYNWVHNK